MNVKEAIKERLKELRQEIGESQNSVARAVGVSQSTIAGYEVGDRLPSYEILVKLCKYYKTSADYVLGLKDYE